MGRYIEWLSIVNPHLPAFHRVPKYQIKTWSREYIAQNTIVIEECARIVNTTKSPDEFFAQYTILLERLHKFAILRKYVAAGYFPTMRPKDKYLEVKANRGKAASAMIERGWGALLKRVKEADSFDKKKNLFDDFFESVYNHSDQMTADNLHLLGEKQSEINLNGYLTNGVPAFASLPDELNDPERFS
jgi:hypothetical protein